MFWGMGGPMFTISRWIWAWVWVVLFGVGGVEGVEGVEFSLV